MTGDKLFASPSIPVALKKCGSAHRAAGSREAPGRASWSMSVMAIFHQRSDWNSEVGPRISFGEIQKAHSR